MTYGWSLDSAVKSTFRLLGEEFKSSHKVEKLIKNWLILNPNELYTVCSTLKVNEFLTFTWETKTTDAQNSDSSELSSGETQPSHYQGMIHTSTPVDIMTYDKRNSKLSLSTETSDFYEMDNWSWSPCASFWVILFIESELSITIETGNLFKMGGWCST